LGAGGICMVVAFVDFARSMNGMEPPHLFWMFFLGMPLMFAGFVMSQMGFMGAVTRFMAGEAAPVATDTANYVAKETEGAVETVAKAAAKGIVEGIDEARSKPGEGKD
ncbi:MAG TPA: hypothetical protein VN625_09395, partial [Desulfuromonadaceae bacterium]|nr:hypothetical protein [Desulfuromonadaceae bacterium]